MDIVMHIKLGINIVRKCNSQCNSNTASSSLYKAQKESMLGKKVDDEIYCQLQTTMV